MQVCTCTFAPFSRIFTNILHRFELFGLEIQGKSVSGGQKFGKIVKTSVSNVISKGTKCEEGMLKHLEEKMKSWPTKDSSKYQSWKEVYVKCVRMRANACERVRMRVTNVIIG